MAEAASRGVVWHDCAGEDGGDAQRWWKKRDLGWRSKAEASTSAPMAVRLSYEVCEDELLE